MTFSQLCQDMRCTPQEREKLAWHLAMLRAKETFDRLTTSPVTSNNSGTEK